MERDYKGGVIFFYAAATGAVGEHSGGIE